jgi:hypothetical protein
MFLFYFIIYLVNLFFCVLYYQMFINMFHTQMQLMRRLDQWNKYICVLNNFNIYISEWFKISFFKFCDRTQLCTLMYLSCYNTYKLTELRFSPFCCSSTSVAWVKASEAYVYPMRCSYRISRPIRRIVIFSLENLKKKKSTLILVIYCKKTALLHTKISSHNIIYSSEKTVVTATKIIFTVVLTRCFPCFFSVIHGSNFKCNTVR